MWTKVLNDSLYIKYSREDYFNGEVEICLAKNYLAPQLCKKIFGCYTVYLVSGINHFRLFFPDKSTQEVLNENFKIDPTWINKNEVITNTMVDKLICNSKKSVSKLNILIGVNSI